jgi:MscS family membrane protein
VARAVEFFERVQKLPYKPTAGSPGLHLVFATRGGWMIPDAFVRRLPAWAHAVVGGETVWQWAAAAILVVATIVLLAVARGISRRAVLDVDPHHPVRHAAAFVFPLAAIGASLLLDYALTWQVRFTGETLYATKIALKVLMFAGVIFGVVAMIRGAAEVVIRAKRLRPEGIDGQLVRLACQVSTFVAVAWLLIVGANSMGISVTPLIAGLSVSGLAVALAAQYTVENLIAGVVLFIDKPVRIGDACQFGELKGTVEQIGLRSTRIRGVDRTLISIPNAEFAKLRLVNYTRRDRILFQHTIGLTYDASASQIRTVVDRIHHMMLSHPRVANEPIEVQMVGYGPSSLDIEIVGYVLTSEGAIFLDVQQEILLAIMGIVEEVGCDFAFPTQTLHVVGDTAAAAQPVFVKKAA